MKRFILTTTTALALSFGGGVMAQDLSEEDIKRLALEAIMENPQIIMDAVALLREQEAEAKTMSQSQALEENKELLTQDVNAPVAGNPDGDVTIVEFFDYNCGYCKRSANAMKELLAGDKNIRVVYREFPILAESSVYAARASLAARKQDKYEEFHYALMEKSGLDEKSILLLATEVGLDVGLLVEEMKSDEVEEHISTTRELAEAMQFTGTPSFIIGDQIVPGYVELDDMKKLVAEARG